MNTEHGDGRRESRVRRLIEPGSVRGFALAVVAALLSGCAAITLVETGRQTVHDAYTVSPQVAWSRVTQPDVEVWTIDGFVLQSLQFFRLDDGDSLYTTRTDQPGPTFVAGSTPSEVAEFVVDSMAQQGATSLEVSGLRPSPFGALEGFRFELSYRQESGLEADGMVLGAVQDEELHLILYAGARAHYFPKYRDVVERLFDSVRTGSAKG